MATKQARSIIKNPLGVLALVLLLCLVFPLASSAQENETALIELEAIVVTAKMDDYIQKNPSQVVSMGAREIQERNFLQVTEAISTMAGVDVKSGSSGLGTRISIRGGGGSGSVRILVGGRPMSTLQYGGTDLGSIPIDIVKKITVFKPPVPVWLGPGSSAGAIYIETKSGVITLGEITPGVIVPGKIIPGPIEPGQIQSGEAEKKAAQKGRVRLSGGSYGQANASATLKVDADDTDYLLSGSYGHTDGKRANSQKDQGSLNFHYGKKAEFNYQVNASAFISDHGVAGPTYNPTPNASQRYEKASLDFKADGMVLNLLDSGALEYDVNAYLDAKHLDDTANNGDTSQLDTIVTGLGSNFFHVNAGEDKEFRFGTLLEHSQVDHTLTGEHQRDLASLNGVYTIRSAPFIFTTGLRSDYTNDFHFSLGSHAGLSYEMGKQTIVKGNIGYSENIPSFGQLYQPSHGSMDQVTGNPDLEKEKILSLSLGIAHTFDNKTQLDLSLFRTDTRDLIKYNRGVDLISHPENISQAYKQGMEASFTFFLSQASDLDLNYIWQNTNNRDNDKN